MSLSHCVCGTNWDNTGPGNNITLWSAWGSRAKLALGRAQEHGLGPHVVVVYHQAQRSVLAERRGLGAREPRAIAAILNESQHKTGRLTMS